MGKGALTAATGAGTGRMAPSEAPLWQVLAGKIGRGAGALRDWAEERQGAGKVIGFPLWMMTDPAVEPLERWEREGLPRAKVSVDEHGRAHIDNPNGRILEDALNISSLSPLAAMGAGYAKRLVKSAPGALKGLAMNMAEGVRTPWIYDKNAPRFMAKYGDDIERMLTPKNKKVKGTKTQGEGKSIEEVADELNLALDPEDLTNVNHSSTGLYAKSPENLQVLSIDPRGYDANNQIRSLQNVMGGSSGTLGDVANWMELARSNHGIAPVSSKGTKHFTMDQLLDDYPFLRHMGFNFMPDDEIRALNNAMGVYRSRSDSIGINPAAFDEGLDAVSRVLEHEISHGIHSNTGNFPKQLYHGSRGLNDSIAEYLYEHKMGEEPYRFALADLADRLDYKAAPPAYMNALNTLKEIQHGGSNLRWSNDIAEQMAMLGENIPGVINGSLGPGARWMNPHDARSVSQRVSRGTLWPTKSAGEYANVIDDAIAVAKGRVTPDDIAEYRQVDPNQKLQLLRMLDQMDSYQDIPVPFSPKSAYSVDDLKYFASPHVETQYAPDAWSILQRMYSQKNPGLSLNRRMDPDIPQALRDKIRAAHLP